MCAPAFICSLTLILHGYYVLQLTHCSCCWYLLLVWSLVPRPIPSFSMLHAATLRHWKAGNESGEEAVLSYVEFTCKLHWRSLPSITFTCILVMNMWMTNHYIHTHSHTYIHRYSDFLTWVVSVGLALAHPNYLTYIIACTACTCSQYVVFV